MSGPVDATVAPGCSDVVNAYAPLAGDWLSDVLKAEAPRARAEAARWCVLTADRHDPEIWFGGRWMESLARTLGKGAADGSVASIDVDQLVSDAWLRGLSWADYPWVAENPRFRNHASDGGKWVTLHVPDGSGRWRMMVSDRSFAPVRRVAGGVRRWFIDVGPDVPWGMGGWRARTCGQAGLFLAGSRIGGGTVATLLPQGGGDDLGQVQAAAAALAAPALEMFRFEQQYKANFRALIGPALLPLAERAGSGEVMSRSVSDPRPRWRRGLYDTIAEPMALQVLYRVARGEKDDDLLCVPAGEDAYDARMRLKPGVDDLGLLPWEGTGKHAPGAITRREARRLYEHVLEPWLVTPRDPANGFRRNLTPFGEALLDALPPDCEDADLRLRWTDPASGSIAPEHAAAVDDWTRRWFGKVKNRVDEGRIPKG